jgi:DNA replication protein DnaC
VDKMAEAEIPVDYWFRRMKDFYGDVNFKNVILEYVNDISGQYSNGLVHCFAGPRGTGKTFSACQILKESIKKGYTSYYITMIDAVSKLLSSESHQFRKFLKQCDFLVLDEVDQRFFPSQGSQDLYGNHFEYMIRTRTQNKLPTIMCTNSEDISQIFGGEFKRSFESLNAQFVKVLRAGGKDVRKNQEKL